MLTPEQAQERLKAFDEGVALGRTLTRLRAAGGRLSELGQLLIRHGAAWNAIEITTAFHIGPRMDLGERLMALGDRDRSALFKALFPNIVPQLEAAWRLFNHLPYQVGSYRRAFRNPDAGTDRRRADWFAQLAFTMRAYAEQDIAWFAAWAAHLGFYAPDCLGYLLAGAIDVNDKPGREVFDILIASGNGTHEVGAMGRHVIRALLCASRPDGWEYVERLLLAAQREEGLRQVILEGVDEAHPDAFLRMLRVIIDKNLIRFTAAMRAFMVWLGISIEDLSPKALNEILSRTLRYLENPAEREAALHANDAQDAYFALWAAAFYDAQAALPHAIRLRKSSDVEVRFAATHLLAQLGLAGALPELLGALEDEDLRFAARALPALTRWHFGADLLEKSDLFERLERLIARLPHKQNSFKPLLWDWFTLSISREEVARLMLESRGSRPLARLEPYIEMMGANGRSMLAYMLRSAKKDAAALKMLLKLAGDASSQVNGQALEQLKDFKLNDEQVRGLEDLLTRTAENLRRGVIQLLLGQPDKAVLASAGRLLAHRSDGQRTAGLELLQACKDAGRSAPAAAQLARDFQREGNPSPAAQRLLEKLLDEEAVVATLEDALGLMNPAGRTPRTPPRARRGFKLGSPAAVRCLLSLDALVEAHRNEEIEVAHGGVRQQQLLGNAGFRFMVTAHYRGRQAEQGLTDFPLADVWEAWWRDRPRELRDDDGFEMIRAVAALALFQPRYVAGRWDRGSVDPALNNFMDVRLDFTLKYLHVVRGVMEYLVWKHPAQGEVDFVIDALEESVARIPSAEMTGVSEHYGRRDRTLNMHRLTYLHITRGLRRLRPEAWQGAHHARMWRVLHWIDQPAPGVPRIFPDTEEAALGYEAGAATRDDLLDLFLGPRDGKGHGVDFPHLRELSGRRPNALMDRYPILGELLDLCRRRIVEVESTRGDLPGAATVPASSIRSVPGMADLFRLLKGLDRRGFQRGYLWGVTRSAVLSHLIRNCYPLPGDTPEAFADAVRSNAISERRLVELAVYAPQWTRFVQHTLAWPKLADAVWWVYAHTKDRQWNVEPELRAEWAASVGEYTPLPADSLMDGAVDVAWFRNFHGDLDAKHWDEIYRAAEYAAGGAGHTRARLFADAMLGELSVDDCATRIQTKRHQDSVRALGLIPLSGRGAQQEQVLQRYEVMQEFLRTGKKFGSMRQTSEKLAVAIGMENLARTAGYPDPLRLEWAMEIEAVADLAEGPVSAEAKDVRVTLSINALGEPELAVEKKGKPAKSVPAALKKDTALAPLFARKQKLDRQISRMRLSLEQAMCRGDVFIASELAGLFRHPMLRVLIEQLVFTFDGGMGYPVNGGTKLQGVDGALIDVARVRAQHAAPLRLAHPMDFLEGGQWHRWQHECFMAERIQPFKQVFRELYVLTNAEKTDSNLSRRYAGHQVNPRQAMAIFGARGWRVDPEAGVQKTFHDAGLTAHVGFLEGGYTPADIEGLTLEAAGFTRRGAGAEHAPPLPLESIPPRIFSEVMRDLDLVVSAAHAGGVDPEASASSIEARAALIRETTGLLRLDNIRMTGAHAIVNGRLGSYSVHLGSAVVHKQPGGALCIIPVHGQHRGRLFLPFVDNDPKSAEVVSKVILLARDDQIKDPTILEQIRSV